MEKEGKVLQVCDVLYVCVGMSLAILLCLSNECDWERQAGSFHIALSSAATVTAVTKCMLLGCKQNEKKTPARERERAPELLMSAQL